MDKIIIGVLGFGKLGEHIVKRLVQCGVSPSRIYVLKRSSSRLRAEALGLTIVEPSEFVKADCVIVTLKGYQFEAAWKSLGVENVPLLISCMAKGSLAELARVMGSHRVARLMTSTPCEIGKGIGAWIACGEMKEEDLAATQQIAALLGNHRRAANEEEIAFATTLSTINGLIYLVIQYFEEAMVYIGAPKGYVELVVPTIESAIDYRRHRREVHLVAMADDVTSPAGGTSAARFEFAKAALPATVTQAVAAAYRVYTVR